jgi:hypothetical protein
MFHATFVAKHVKIIFETSILNLATSNICRKSKSATSQTFICNTGKKHLQILQHPKISIETSWATIATWKKHLQILKHPKISIETSRDTYCNMEKRALVAEPRRAATREATLPQ